MSLNISSQMLSNLLLFVSREHIKQGGIFISFCILTFFFFETKFQVIVVDLSLRLIQN